MLLRLAPSPQAHASPVPSLTCRININKHVLQILPGVSLHLGSTPSPATLQPTFLNPSLCQLRFRIRAGQRAWCLLVN